jgi:SAM-dependent methyltransferase
MPDVHVTRGPGLLEGFLAKKRTRIANGLIPESHGSGRVLDVGCGTYPYFLHSTRFRERYGIDQVVSEKDVRRAESAGIRLIACNIGGNEPLPFDNETFDVVTMLAVLEHISGPRLVPVLQEVRRVLKREGVFILTTPAPWTDGLLRLLAALRLVSPVEIAEHKGAYGPAAIRRLLTEAGFAADRIETGYFELGMNVWARARKE